MIRSRRRDRRRSRCLTALLILAAMLFAGCGGDDGSPTSSALDREDGALEPTPQRLIRHCDAIAATRRLPVLCPRQLPSGRWIAAHLFTADGRCSYLLDLDTRPRTSPFHALVGGRCREWSLRTAGGRWPARVPLDDDLRLVGSRSLTAGQTERRREHVRPRVLRRTRVAGRRALLLAAARYPAGGLHGDHRIVIWNQRGNAYALSLHAEPGARRSPEAQEAILLRVAESMSLSPAR